MDGNFVKRRKYKDKEWDPGDGIRGFPFLLWPSVLSVARRSPQSEDPVDKGAAPCRAPVLKLLIH